MRGIRNTGGAESTNDYIRANPKDMGLVMSVPHSIQPVVLEDNQATIRILESGKSPAFRHADKTQRINLGWLSEQFRRKHYQLASISTSLQAADILTKPFTSIEKWTKALKLIAVGEIKSNARSSSTVLPGNREKVIEARKKFVKLWASFVDMCDGLDKIGDQYAVEWPKHCVYWDWSRVRKWIEARPIQKAHFDGCRFGLINRKGEYVKKPWTIATTIPQLYDKFSNRCCKGGHIHGKCTKESESYTSPFARAVHSTFHAFVTEAQHSRPRRATVAAVATQASQASLLAFNLPVAYMAAIRKPVLYRPLPR